MDQLKIGLFIAECRRVKGLTQAQLAEMLNLTDRAISKWETGKSIPDPSVMLRLSEILGISTDELLKGEYAAGREAGDRSVKGKKRGCCVWKYLAITIGLTLVVMLGMVFGGKKSVDLENNEMRRVIQGTVIDRSNSSFVVKTDPVGENKQTFFVFSADETTDIYAKTGKENPIDEIQIGMKVTVTWVEENEQIPKQRLPGEDVNYSRSELHAEAIEYVWDN